MNNSNGNENTNNSNDTQKSEIKLNKVKPSASDKRSFRRNDTAEFSEPKDNSINLEISDN